MQEQQQEFCSGVRQVLDEGGQLIDVRSVAEFASGAIRGAINLPLHLLPLKHRDLDPARPVLLYCVSGTRSQQAAYFLSQQGFEEVYDLGGYAALSRCDIQAS